MPTDWARFEDVGTEGYVIWRHVSGGAFVWKLDDDPEEDGWCYGSGSAYPNLNHGDLLPETDSPSPSCPTELEDAMRLALALQGTD